MTFKFPRIAIKIVTSSQFFINVRNASQQQITHRRFIMKFAHLGVILYVHKFISRNKKNWSSHLQSQLMTQRPRFQSWAERSTALELWFWFCSTPSSLMDSSAWCRRWPRWWMGLQQTRHQKTLTWRTNKTRLWARRKDSIWLNKSWITANRHLIQLSADIIRPQLITHLGHSQAIGRLRAVPLRSTPASDALDTGEGAAGRRPTVWWMKSSVRARKYTFSVTGRG